MKSLRESLFDKDLVGKNLTLDQFFDISVTRYIYDNMRDDKRVEKEIEKQVNSIDLKSFDCKELTNALSNISKKHTKNWHGGGYWYSFYDKSGRKINSNNLQTFNLLDVSKIVMRCEDWNNNYITYRTLYTLTRK